MQPNRADEGELIKILSKLHTIEAQQKLVLLVKDSKQSLESKIIPSLQPKVGRKFRSNDLECEKKSLLMNVRE